MKICLLTRRFSLDSGGIGRVSTEIRDGLERLGHEVYTVSTNELSLTGYFKYTFFDIRSKIPNNMDIYHAITPMESIWIPKNRGITTVLDIIPVVHPEKHGARMGSSKTKQRIGKICFTIGCRQAAQCQRVACISEQGKREFTNHFNISRSRVKVITLGIREDLKPKLNSGRVFRIGYLGQLDRRKRVDLLIRAFSQSSLDAELVIGGTGSINRDTMNVDDDGRIKFVGHVPDDELADFYNSMNVLVFPTAIEGYGLPIVEAMACNVPVIVLADAIIPHEVKARCIVVEDLGTTFSSLLYLIRLCSDTRTAENHAWAKTHRWEECVEKYVKLYEDVLSC